MSYLPVTIPGQSPDDSKWHRLQSSCPLVNMGSVWSVISESVLDLKDNRSWSLSLGTEKVTKAAWEMLWARHFSLHWKEKGHMRGGKWDQENTDIFQKTEPGRWRILGWQPQDERSVVKSSETGKEGPCEEDEREGFNCQISLKAKLHKKEEDERGK